MDLSFFLSTEFLMALGAIWVIDLVLAVDNAIVIGVASQRCAYRAPKASHPTWNSWHNRNTNRHNRWSRSST